MRMSAPLIVVSADKLRAAMGQDRKNADDDGPALATPHVLLLLSQNGAGCSTNAFSTNPEARMSELAVIQPQAAPDPITLVETTAAVASAVLVKWGLPADYRMVAPADARQRWTAAEAVSLGTQGRNR